MKKLLTICLLAVTMCAMAQEQVQSKRIAILETVDKDGTVPYGIKLQLRQSITFAISRTPGYDAYNRIDMSSINGEQTFQRTGMVSDADIKKLGVMTGAAYVLIAEAAPYDDAHIIITANLVNVESAQVESATYPIVSDKDPEAMAESCKKIAQILLNVSGGPVNSPYPPRSGAHADFTETAWDINMKMVWVEGGDFMMGCTSEQSDCRDDEQNVRRVTVDGYWIGMYEVTQSQWEKVMGTNIYQQRNKKDASRSLYGMGADYPMYYVNWDEAMEFCRMLSQKTGKTYTLPTEAQWEYAARGGNKADGTKYAGSNMIDAVAWYTYNSGDNTHPVGTKRGNALGIYDMSGNVWEWCKDWYSDNYVSYDTNNPTGPYSGYYRVRRGGGWDYGVWGCRVSDRNHFAPYHRFGYVGFRVVLIP